MKKHHLITTAMAGLTVLTGGMLSSCSDEEAVSTEQTQAKASYYTAQAVNADTAEARAKVFPALAWLPKGTNTYITGNVTEFLSVYNKISGSEPIEIPLELQAIDTLAIGLTEGTEKTFEDLVNVHNQVLEGILKEKQPDVDRMIKSIADAAQKIKPIYLVATCHTEDEAKALAAQLNFLIALSLKDAPFLKTSQLGGWNLVTCKPADIPAELTGANLSACGDLAVSLGITSRGNAMVAALTVNPQELQVPATAAESVLGTDAANALDDALNGKGLAAASISPNLANALRDYYVRFVELAISGYSDMNKRIGKKTESVEQGVAAFKTLAALYKKLMPYSKHPSGITLWQDGDLHLCLQCDSGGVEFSTAQLNTTMPQDALVYAYGSGVANMNCPSMEDIDRAAEAVFTLVSISESASDAQKCREIYNDIKGILPHLTTLHNSMGKGWVATADLSATETYYITPSIPAIQQPAPCIRLAMQLDNRTAFENAVADTFAGVKALVQKYSPKDAAEMDTALASIVKAQNGSYTTYTHPVVNRPHEGLKAGVVISDSALGVGSDMDKTQQLCDSFSGNTAVSGIVVNLNMSIMEAYLEQCKNALEAAKNNPEIEADTISYIEELVQNRQDTLNEFRDVLQIITGGSLSITSENGCSKTHIKVYTPALK